MNLIQIIEEFDPGHFSRRELYLRKMKQKFEDLGFFPLQITESDIHCYQLVFEDNRGQKYRGTSITVETLEDVLENPDCQFMKTMKDVLRYEKP
jgi:hypothetical protein